MTAIRSEYLSAPPALALGVGSATSVLWPIDRDLWGLILIVGPTRTASRSDVSSENHFILTSDTPRVLNELAIAAGAARCQNPLMPLRAHRGTAPWPHVLLVYGAGFRTAVHRHHCVQLLMTLRGSLLVRSGRESAWRKCGAVWVRPDATHEVDARGSPLLIGYINAESEFGASLAERIEDAIACVPDGQVARWRAVLGSTPNEARAERWLIEFLPHGQRGVAIHPGVRRVLSHLEEPQAALDGLSLKTLAGIAGLSPSRFMHAFTESVGVPVRPYILWHRLQRAACDMMNGANVTSAAHRAGFSDSAHLTRTFRRMLGATPSDLALLKRLSLGFSLESSEWPNRAVRAITGAA